jgi:hypothetical protein
MMIAFWVGICGMNPTIQRVYREVERNDKQERVADLLPQVFRWARSVDPAQPLTSAVWDGDRADPGRHSIISGIQLGQRRRDHIPLL